MDPVAAYTSRAHNDSLLRGLTENQRAYIIKHLYPTLKEAINVFAIEAQRTSHFEGYVTSCGRQTFFSQGPPQSVQYNQQPSGAPQTMTSEKLNKLFANYSFKARSINTKTNTTGNA